MKTIDFGRGDHVQHINEDDLNEGATLPEEVIAFIQRRIKEQNGGADGVTCGGCTLATLLNAVKVTLHHAEATAEDAERELELFNRETRKLLLAAQAQALSDPKAKIYADDFSFAEAARKKRGRRDIEEMIKKALSGLGEIDSSEDVPAALKKALEDTGVEVLSMEEIKLGDIKKED